MPARGLVARAVGVTAEVRASAPATVPGLACTLCPARGPDALSPSDVGDTTQGNEARPLDQVVHTESMIIRAWKCAASRSLIPSHTPAD